MASQANVYMFGDCVRFRLDPHKQKSHYRLATLDTSKSKLYHPLGGQRES
jgi:hypothetical protein